MVDMLVRDLERLLDDVLSRASFLDSDSTATASASESGVHRVITEPNEDAPTFGGRRPPGLLLVTRERARTVVGAYFARLAASEGASVVAFRRLRSELVRHGAPLELAQEAEASAWDHVAHARAMERIAARYGAAPPPSRIAGSPPRDLFGLALDNVVEGCVRETFGALHASYQARAALDPAIRSAMLHLARDEAKHASLAFRIGAWLDDQLTRNERGAVARARARAVEDIRSALAAPRHETLVTIAGLPSSERSLTLLRDVDRSVWHAIAA